MRQHSYIFRATGILPYTQNQDTLANHSAPKTTKLYDKSGETGSLDAIAKTRF